MKSTRSALTLFALFAAAFLLVGCGAAPATGWASPRVVDQTVYVASSAGKILALNLADGTSKWQAGFPADKSLGALYGTPAFADGVLYVGAFDHKLYAIDATTGAKKGNEYDAGAPIVSSPVVGNGMVYFGSNNKKIYALDAATNAWKWDFVTNGEVWADLTLVGNTLYAASLDHKLYALDAITGVKKWDYDTNGIIVTKPAVADGIIYIAGLAKLYAVDTTGAKKWEFEASNWIWSNPTVTNGVVYFGALDGSVYALDAQTGKAKWSAPFKAGDAVRSAIVIDGGVAYFGADDFKIYALDVATGQYKTSRATNGRVLGAPAIANGVLLVQSYDHVLYALDATNLQGKWALNMADGKMITPVPGVVK